MTETTRPEDLNGENSLNSPKEGERTMSSAEKEQKRISRREFVKGAAVGAAGAAAAGALAACGPTPEVIKETVEVEKVVEKEVPVEVTKEVEVIKEVEAKPWWLPEKWDYEADVIVVGSGLAGISCAANAAINGASVIVLEASENAGGKGRCGGGNLGIGGGTRMQKEKGFYEDAEIIYQDRTLMSFRGDDASGKIEELGLEGGGLMEVEDIEGGVHVVPMWRRIGGATDAEGLSRVFADRSLDTWNWLDSLGASFEEATVSPKNNVYRGSRYYTRSAGMPVFREEPEGAWMGGAGYWWPMHDAAVENGAEILVNHKMTRIIRADGERAGRVLGVEVEAEGQTLYFRGTKGVMLATGSWNCDPVLKVLFCPWYIKYPHKSGEPFNWNPGNGIRAALDIGASLTTEHGSTSWHGWHRHAGSIYHSARQPIALRGVSEPSPDACIYVNANGERFMDEEIGEHCPSWIGGNEPFFFQEICSLQPTDADGPVVWIILDEDARAGQDLNLTPGEECYAEMVAEAATLAELASKIGVPADALSDTVDRYNSLVVGGEDLDFHKKELAAKIETPPFHAIKWGIMKHNTIGGITHNEKAQVMDFHGSVIPGLYCAGECAGGMDLIGNAKPIVFGRVAGEWLAKETG